MNEFQVTCIIKPDRLNTHEHITHMGNLAAKWFLTRESAIQKIDSGAEAFYTVDRGTGRKMYVGVVRGDGTRLHTCAHMRTANGTTIS